MRRTIAALLFGECLLLAGLFMAWIPLALIVAGGQLVALVLFRETGDGA